MSQTKQLIERNLTFDQKYIYLGITRGNLMDGQFCTCDNCGKLITNMVSVVNKESGKNTLLGRIARKLLVRLNAFIIMVQQPIFI
jgi:hypothetical protein